MLLISLMERQDYSSQRDGPSRQTPRLTRSAQDWLAYATRGDNVLDASHDDLRIQDKLLDFMVRAHGQLASFARASYEREGRGAVFVSIPDAPSGDWHLVRSTDMVHQVYAEVRRIMGYIQGDSEKDASVPLRRIETYDPATEAVVTVAFKSGDLVTPSMRLELPVSPRRGGRYPLTLTTMGPFA